eukprot:1547296-Rhodomonas_salina.3
MACDTTCDGDDVGACRRSTLKAMCRLRVRDGRAQAFASRVGVEVTWHHHHDMDETGGHGGKYPGLDVVDDRMVVRKPA